MSASHFCQILCLAGGFAITYKMQVQQPTKPFCNFMQKVLAKNRDNLLIHQTYFIFKWRQKRYIYIDSSI